MEEALKIMDIGKREPDRAAPAVPAKVLSERCIIGVSIICSL